MNILFYTLGYTLKSVYNINLNTIPLMALTLYSGLFCTTVQQAKPPKLSIKESGCTCILHVYL